MNSKDRSTYSIICNTWTKILFGDRQYPYLNTLNNYLYFCFMNVQWMRIRSVLFTCLLITFIANSQSYSKSGNYNRIGIQGKIGSITLDTDDLNVDGASAFLGGFTTRGRLYNNFGVVYGLDLLHSRLNLRGRSVGEVQREDIRYTLIGAQLHLLGSYNIIQDRIAIDFGPALLINGALSVDRDAQRSTLVSDFQSLTAEDIQDISRVNPFGIIGITAGFTNVRVTAQYQVGLSNILKRLNNDGSLSTIDSSANNFKGRLSLLTAGIVLLL